MTFFIRLLCTVFFSLWAVGNFYELWLFRENLTTITTEGSLFICGVLLYALTFPIWSSMQFFHTFIHEFNHMFFSIICLRGVTHFMVDSEGEGYVENYGNNPLIVLAPYGVPIISLLLLAFSVIVIESVRPVFHLFVGFFLLCHIHSLIRDFRFYQWDLQEYGIPFSCAFVAWCNSLLVPAVVISSMCDFHSMRQFVLAFPKEVFFYLK